MRLDDEQGAQALEFALVTPLLLMAVLAMVGAGVAGATLLSTQHAAVQLARAAAVADDQTVIAGISSESGATTGAAADDAMGGHAAGALRIMLDPPSPIRQPGDLVTVTVRRDVSLLGVTLPVTFTATALVEDVS